MSDRMLDIQIGVSLPIPDVGIAVNRRWKTVNIEVSKGGAYYPEYPGPYHVTPRFYIGYRLDTYGKSMTDDVVVDSIPVTETHNPQGGKTIVIG